MNPWLIAAVISFALLGAVTAAVWIWNGARTVIGIVKDLAAVLHEAVATAKEFRADFALVRQIADSAGYVQSQVSQEPESIIPKNDKPQEPVVFPPPYLDRFPKKPFEEDAPPEAGSDVDVTGSEEEMAETEGASGMPTIEEQERMKQVAREAEEQRRKELAEMGIPEKLENE